ncbi:unnamed protein product [Ranitomeya imitator]|uniref:Cyclin-D-binding Myb-like transcription factor 1 n=1 Tax=Ranitomeya imitator TaxID=111125 RepID=A0ABN9MKY8_9NEOB|nr:unnamed protein product [Ranitomeya imitator]
MFRAKLPKPGANHLSFTLSVIPFADTCVGKWTDEEERRLTDVVHELTGTESGDIVTQGVSWASVAERVGTRSEKQCRSKWLNYLNWKQSGGTQWTKGDEINLILRIAELGVLDENDINWDILSEGWSSVRSPQWLRSKWWTVKRQIANHKDVSFPVLIKGLRQLHESQTTLLGVQEELENKADIESQSGSTSVQHVQIRVAHLEESPNLPQSSMASLQIPPRLNPPLLMLTQTCYQQEHCKHLRSYHQVAPQAPSSFRQVLPKVFPLTLTSNQGVTLTSNTSPASPEQIIVHALSPENLLNASDNVTVHCHTPGIIIRTLASDNISSPLAQTELSVDPHLQQNDLHSAERSLKADCLPQEMHNTDLTVSRDSLYCPEQSINVGIRGNVKLLHHPGTHAADMPSADRRTDDTHIDVADNYVKEPKPALLIINFY